MSGLGCLYFKLIHFCVLWKAEKESWSGIFFIGQNFYLQKCGHKLSVFQKQHRLVCLCHFLPLLLLLLLPWRDPKDRNAAKEKGTPEASRQVVTSKRVCSVSLGLVEAGGGLV